MRTLKEWLEEDPKRVEVFAVLISKNGGGTKVYGYGTITSANPPFGTGLSQDEALALMEFSGFVSGIEWAGGVEAIEPGMMMMLEWTLKKQGEWCAAEAKSKEVSDGDAREGTAVEAAQPGAEEE